MLVRSGNGRFLPGFALASRRDMFSANAALIACSRPILKRLAGLTQGVAHIGILEDDMVTYLVREGTEVGTIFSKEDRQLEAYCSALGKMLLGSMPAELQDAYLASAPFVALTDRTITDPEALRAELRRVAAQGFAHDNGEAATGVRCFAVPVRDRQGAAVAALSLSVAGRELDHTTALASLSEARAQLENALYPV